MSDFDNGYRRMLFEREFPRPVPAQGEPTTHDGLPAVKNADGSHSTELSITVTDPRLNGGRPTNIPSLWGGKVLDENQSVIKAIQSGRGFQSYESIDEAVNAAKQRSAAGGAMARPSGKPKETGAVTAGMDVLAGLLKGSVAATLGLPGDVESLVRLLAGGEQKLPTTEDIQAKLPPVVNPPAGDPGDPGYLKRNNRATAAEVAGEFIPLAPVAAAAKAARKLGKKGATQAAAGTAAMATAQPTGDRVIRYDSNGKRMEASQ